MIRVTLVDGEFVAEDFATMKDTLPLIEADIRAGRPVIIVNSYAALKRLGLTSNDVSFSRKDKEEKDE